MVQRYISLAHLKFLAEHNTLNDLIPISDTVGYGAADGEAGGNMSF
jgi:hypothetical protein